MHSEGMIETQSGIGLSKDQRWECILIIPDVRVKFRIRYWKHILMSRVWFATVTVNISQR